MAIARASFKSQASAPPSEAHFEYISRIGKYASMGEPLLAVSGNMPDFARNDPRQFWNAADENERKNGRTYTELVISLPRELSNEQNARLARKAVSHFMGDRFAYTVAIHAPEAADGKDQPHMHLMFSERAIDRHTRLLQADQFFKRNGAKKDRSWNDRDKPQKIRYEWCELLNGALREAGLDLQVDPRSLLDQGKLVEALLVEPKMLLKGTNEQKQAREAEIHELREAKAVLARMDVEPNLEAIEETVREVEEDLEFEVEAITQEAEKELSTLDQAIGALRSFADKLRKAAECFIRNKQGDPLEEARFFRSPVQVERDVKHTGNAELKESAQIIRAAIVETNFQELKKKFPHETDSRLRSAADAQRLSIPLGKSKEISRPDRGR